MTAKKTDAFNAFLKDMREHGYITMNEDAMPALVAAFNAGVRYGAENGNGE